MFEDLLPQIVGPLGGLVLAVVGLGILGRLYIKAMQEKDRLNQQLLDSKDAQIVKADARALAAEARLDTLGGLLKDATTVMEKSVTVTEKVIEVADRAQDRAEAFDRAQAAKRHV